MDFKKMINNCNNEFLNLVEQYCQYLEERKDANNMLADVLKQAEDKGYDKTAFRVVATEYYKISQDDELQAELNQQRQVEDVYREALNDTGH